MPQDIEPVRALDRDRLHNCPFWQRAMQVPQLAVDPGGDDGAVITEEIESCGGRVRHSLLADATCCDGDGHGGHDRFPSCAAGSTRDPGKPRPGNLEASMGCPMGRDSYADLHCDPSAALRYGGRRSSGRLAQW